MLTATGGVFIVGQQGTAAEQPPATHLPANFTYYQTDTNILQVVSGGVWQTIGGEGVALLLSDGSTTVVPVIEIDFSGLLKLTDAGGGVAQVTTDGPIVTVQAGVPAGPFQTPLVFDSTAVTGGLYGWDGSAYQKIGGPL